MSASTLVVEALRAVPGVELAVLFGSTARGKAAPGSDVDVAVRLREPTPEAWTRLEVALARAAGRAVDQVDIDRAPPQLRFEIARDGVLLVEGREHAWADFRARAMLDWWDWAPIARRIHGAAARRLREQAGLGTR